MSIFWTWWLGILIHRSSGVISLPVEIEIVTPGYFGVDSLASMTYLKPAFITGLASLKKTLPEFDVSHRFLIDANATTCLSQLATVQDILSRWYYLERRNTSIPVILTTGKHILYIESKTAYLY
jgi:hypothetical protein